MNKGSLVSELRLKYSDIYGYSFAGEGKKKEKHVEDF